MSDVPDVGNETFTELDIDERRDLLAKLDAIDPGTVVRLRYHSARSQNELAVQGRVLDRAPDELLYVRTSERQGDVYVSEWNIESKHHAGIVAKSTGSRFTHREPRLGELLDVEVVTDD